MPRMNATHITRRAASVGSSPVLFQFLIELQIINGRLDQASRKLRRRVFLSATGLVVQNEPQVAPFNSFNDTDERKSSFYLFFILFYLFLFRPFRIGGREGAGMGRVTTCTLHYSHFLTNTTERVVCLSGVVECLRDNNVAQINFSALVFQLF
jgi:hypothetical protein